MLETVTDLDTGADRLRARRYGVIEAAAGHVARVRLRPWPHRASLVEVWLAQRRWHARRRGGRCRLYYAQPLGHEAFLSITYIVSHADTSLATLRAALAAAERIARLKGCGALLCQAKNPRLSDRLLARAGWQRHALSLPGRNFIKRLGAPRVAPGEWTMAATVSTAEMACRDV